MIDLSSDLEKRKAQSFIRQFQEQSQQEIVSKINTNIVA